MISRERRDRLRHLIRLDGNRHIIGRTLTAGELRTLLDYADERDEEEHCQKAEACIREKERLGKRYRDTLESEILPELRFGRGMHVQWRNYLKQHPDGEKRNPECGDADFHAKMVEVYDRRIAAIEKARHALSAGVPKPNDGESDDSEGT